jgi:molybdopterin-containing oxidoreductase family iron-sulfur binding subunit
MTKRLDRRIVLPLEREGTSRRTFLRMAGYGVAAATLASCSKGASKFAVSRPTPAGGGVAGRATWIATTCGGCAAGCGVLAKCVDGRPVKLEGNPGHPVSSGGLCAVGQAQVLSLYDARVLDGPTMRGAKSSWDAVDGTIAEKLAAANGRVRVLTGAPIGPSTRAFLADFCAKFGATHVAYDALSASAILDAHRETHGVRALPRYRFERAKVIASFGADFVGTWISPVEFTAGWRAGRRPDASPPTMSRHWQLEARMSLTGTRADRRVRLAPWETGEALAELCDALGAPSRLASSAPRPAICELAAELKAARGECLVVCGENDVALQKLVNLANELLDNYGATVDLAAPSFQRPGDDAALAAVVAEMTAGAVDVLVVHDANPAYDLPASAGFRAALAKVALVVSTSPRVDETSALAHVVCPAPHALESWDDAAPVAGCVSLTQPAIPPLRSSRTLRASLARWIGDRRDDVELLRSHWRANLKASEASFESAFDRALHDGYIRVDVDRGATPSFRRDAVGAPPKSDAPKGGALALVLYPKVAMLAGAHAHNAWLHELPDPVTKTTWDNYACLAPETASRLGVATGDVVRVNVAGAAPLELPALVQPGQHADVVAVALGYGRIGTDRFTKIGPQWLEAKPTVAAGGVVGRNAAPLLVLDARGLRGTGRVASVERTGRHEDLACTQDHHTLEVPKHLAPKRGAVRDAVRTTTLAQWTSDPATAVERPHAPAADLWPPDHVAKGAKWGMAIDLSACSGCSGCVVACQAENNVPAVGRDEVRRHREMQWMRIDRYYAGEGDDTSASHQPLMCQHCANAPCETVCPVLATVHSSEGLNQQVYNRCVGTRYCANNCPYKTRRFNWFDYPREDRLQNLALNPDVTVRSRGVMEKCSLCVQRIQAAKSEAKRRGAPVADGDVRTACQQSCPAGAIVFGDLNDPNSQVSRLVAQNRAYGVLAELNVKPSVTYLADVRNRSGA